MTRVIPPVWVFVCPWCTENAAWMGGNRVPALRWVFNSYTVFILSGLWYGAAWTFIV